jgi:hypothetical protein
MATPKTTVDDIFGDYEKERLSAIEKEQVEYDKPENVAKRKAKSDREFQNGVEQGWWDKDGVPLTKDEDGEDDENEEEEPV